MSKFVNTMDYSSIIFIQNFENMFLLQLRADQMPLMKSLTPNKQLTYSLVVICCIIVNMLHVIVFTFPYLRIFVAKSILLILLIHGAN